MCTTTFLQWYCPGCKCLRSYDQDEETCEHVKNNEPEKCWKEIKSEKLKTLLPCQVCLEKQKEEHKRKYGKEDAIEHNKRAKV
ncbi:hypothetical protein N0V84_001447 [Fusarium piperis]|uniref:Uncharacterized protein n=1 Tax=Fusarium piperis TaxID=1435070 RepID=A0A9W8WLS3_9HYPO|nr:hypothetical protein N0V84_001447 [Fusarium piperis]